jgi:hypothetical protein
LFAFIGFPHAENMTPRVALRVSDYHHSAFEITEADHACFPIALTGVLQIQSRPGDNLGGIFEIESTIG